MPSISIIVPTCKEAANVPVLTEKIGKVMKKESLSYEIIFVDDNSGDGIDSAVGRLKNQGYPVKLKIRTDEKGLSSAVIAGFGLAEGDFYLVMDADLSHPPERIPALVRPLKDGSADFVVGSRFVEGGSASHFNWYRKLNARVSKILASLFVKVKDPMAGFFAFPAHILKDTSILNPLGFKIGLELMVKCGPKKIIEVPIHFQERLYGESKLSIKEQVLYLLHLKRLFYFKYTGLYEFIIFSMIGASGVIVDLFFVFLSYDVMEIPFRLALVVAFVFALSSNFLLNRKFTFPHGKDGSMAKQYVAFFAVCLMGFAVNWFISVYLYENIPFFNRLYLMAAFMGILGGLLINFLGSKFLVFRKKG